MRKIVKTFFLIFLIQVHFLWIYFLGEENLFILILLPLFSLTSLFTASCFPILLFLPYTVFSLKAWKSNWRPEVLLIYFLLISSRGKTIVKYGWKNYCLKTFLFWGIADSYAFARNSTKRPRVPFTQSSSMVISCVSRVQYHSPDHLL